LIARGKMNSIEVRFADGYRMITSGNAIRRAPVDNPVEIGHDDSR
jgi:hypothetical protein